MVSSFHLHFEDQTHNEEIRPSQYATYDKTVFSTDIHSVHHNLKPVGYLTIPCCKYYVAWSVL